MATVPPRSGINENQRPIDTLLFTQSTSDVIRTAPSAQAARRKRRTHGGGKKRKARRKSFIASGEEDADDNAMRTSQTLLDQNTISGPGPPMYRLGQNGANMSETSLDSNALLDHRDHPPMRARRDSRILQNVFGTRPEYLDHDMTFGEGQTRRPRLSRAVTSSRGGSEDDDDLPTHDRTPLLSALSQDAASGYGSYLGRGRGDSVSTSTSSQRRRRISSHQPSASSQYLGNDLSHDVNNPPSVPGTPRLGPSLASAYEDMAAPGSLVPRSPGGRRHPESISNDQVIDIDRDADAQSRSTLKESNDRRRAMVMPAEGDVCFPLDGISEIAEEDYMPQDQEGDCRHVQRRRRYRRWPDLSALEEWSREEQEGRREGIRAKKISEPVLVGGRLRPQKNGWHRAEEDAPYRFTYFNEEFPSTIHSQTISELLQPGQTFRDLFIPEPPEISDDSSDEEGLTSLESNDRSKHGVSLSGSSTQGTKQSPISEEVRTDPPNRPSPERTTSATPLPLGDHLKETPKRHGARPTFWLDVLSPTESEMRVLSKTFGIHPLTSEDILMQEAREKVELFRNYYLVNYRTFEQDMHNEDYLQPVNIYIVVFREGVISFHFSMTPHPANVRRRIRQLQDYLVLTSDWISYAVIDDITDVFGPLIQSIEEEVNDIDDDILQLHSDGKGDEPNEKIKGSKRSEARFESGDPGTGGDMLRRVGQARKKVMRFYRLLGNKADVIKGFAKRCNEQWEIAPRSEIGLYLGDIQDHLLTMTSNLSHYETILSRAHSNYLAQINIRMNERQEQTADVLGKLTVLGTIVLPMNIVTGMWGMNVLVPGQDSDSLTWFWSSGSPHANPLYSNCRETSTPTLLIKF